MQKNQSFFSATAYHKFTILKIIATIFLRIRKSVLILARASTIIYLFWLWLAFVWGINYRKPSRLNLTDVKIKSKRPDFLLPVG